MICECPNCVQPKEEKTEFSNSMELPDGFKLWGLSVTELRQMRDYAMFQGWKPTPAKECGEVRKDYNGGLRCVDPYCENHNKTSPPDRVTDSAKAVEEKINEIITKRGDFSITSALQLSHYLKELVELVRQERK